MNILNDLGSTVQGAALSWGGALVLAQAVPDFALPAWARDSLGMVALLFVGWLLLTERREHRQQLAAVNAANVERLEAIYKSRLEEAREYAAQLDAVRREQHEHTQRLYQDLIQFATAKAVEK